MTVSQLPPGPSGMKFKNAMKMGMGAYDYLTENFEKFGDIYTLQFPGLEPFVWLNRPDQVKTFFNLKPHEYDASKTPLPIDVGVRMTGFLNDAEHALSRKIVVPPLIASRLHSRAEVMHEIISGFIDEIQPGDEFDTPRKVGDMTMDIAIYTLMGLRDCERAAKYKEVMLNWTRAATSNAMFTIGTMYGPQKWRHYLNAKYLKELEIGSTGRDKNRLLPWMKSVDLKVELGNMFREDIRRIREEKDETSSDMFSAMCHATYEDGTLLDEERIISEAMGILVGGHETSAASSAWHMLWMVKKPEVFKKCREEVLASVREHGRFDPLAICDLKYCNAALNESMRLTPSAVGTIRHLKIDLEVDGYKIPAGTNILAGAYIIHRRKDVWGEDAEEFRPERWLEEGAFKPGPFEFFPFGGGRRACIGANHAKQQLRILWGDFYRRLEFDSPFANNNEWPGQQQVSGQTEPAGGVQITIKKRLPADTGYSVQQIRKSA